MTSSRLPAVFDDIARAAASVPGLDLLMVFGSRARGDAHAASDWDFAFLARSPFDLPAFLGTLVEIVGTDRADLADLAPASGLLRFRAARDGRVLYEARPGLADAFCLDAAHFWCDAGPLLQQGYEEVLSELKP